MKNPNHTIERIVHWLNDVLIGGLKCPACGSHLTVLGWDEHDNTIYECKNCKEEWI